MNNEFTFDDANVWATDGDVPDPDTETELPQPAGWRIIVRPLTPRKITKSGIHLPDETLDNESRVQTVGRVLAIGPMAYTRSDMGPMWCQVGDYVLYGKWAGFKFQCNGVKLVTLNDDEIVATVPDPDLIKR